MHEVQNQLRKISLENRKNRSAKLHPAVWLTQKFIYHSWTLSLTVWRVPSKLLKLLLKKKKKKSVTLH